MRTMSEDTMKVVCVGAEPAALYLGILLGRSHAHAVRVIDTGSDRASLPASIVCNPLRPRLKLRDADVQAAATAATAAFDRVTISIDGRRFETGGLPHATMDCVALTAALRTIARRNGCDLRDGPVDPAWLAEADLVVIADPAFAASLADGPTSESRIAATRHIAFRSDVPRDTMHYEIRSTGGGSMHVMTWPQTGGSTVIVEAPLAVVRANKLADADPASILAFGRRHFGSLFDGVTASAGSCWQPFVTRRSRRWHAGNTVLIGAAAYTAHFSVGLDLRAGLEDAETLAEALASEASVGDALAAYDAARRPKAESLQRAAGASQAWFEHVDLHRRLPFEQTVFSLLTASMRMTYARVETAAPDLVRGVDALIAPAADGSRNRPPPPMFAPITLRRLAIPNRVAVSPMCMYSAKDGTVNDFHLVHLGSRAVGGAGLVITEMTDVSPEGRISLHCAGMYAPEHIGAWRRITDFIHRHSASKVAIQLAHAGRKGSLTRSWEGHRGLGEANWEILAPSAIPFAEGRQTPRAMTRADMERIRDAFARAAQMSDEAGFDMIELHFAHGYLISSFISPIANQRTDEYGGSLENRMRFPLEVFQAVRSVWPAEKPISTRISAVDWVEGGTTIDDAVAIARLLHAAGNDILAVSTGGVSSVQRPSDGRAYQAIFSDRIRNELGIPTMTVGGIVSHGDINTIIAAGRADMCALGRGYLEDAYFARHAATAQNFTGLAWPSQYRRAGEVRLRGA
ncbi:MAG: bifunctional salicylyl-CoA 5-hydroxylase/oxidoreductase [Hyphomicrobiales bacterium]|nr:bifunctional salicylyl-CoA 5-hydroxylase/oxidoreductase [Hyphomicrobiales bacterium]